MRLRHYTIVYASFLMFVCSCVEAFSQTSDKSTLDYAKIFQIDDSIHRAELASGRIKPYSPKTRFEGFFTFDVEWHIFPVNLSTQNFLVLTTKELCDTIGKEIRTYCEDVHAIYGYGVYLLTVQNPNPQRLKTLIVNYSNNLCGVLFIGDLGEVFYEIENDYESFGYANWPCDLFFMDMDGEWTDSDNNGIYDTHSGNVSPEIFMARLSAASMKCLGSEANAIRSQLQKSHSYWWRNSYHTASRALNYINSQWLYSFPHFYLRPVFPNNYEPTDCRATPYNTSFSTADYLSRINNSVYGFTQLASHSGITYHVFDSFENIQDYEILAIPSGNYAYNLYCCSACNWTGGFNCYLGGAYLFNNGKTMAVVGSTKKGGMKGENHFYSTFPTNNLGSSFLYWWQHHHDSVYNSETVYNSYGMTILGDPMINFYHNVSDYCVNDLTLTSYPLGNYSNLILYRAGNSITVTNDYSIYTGTHVVFDAPTVTISSGFNCPLGASFEVRSEGCEL